MNTLRKYFEKSVAYNELKAKQQEIYNFQKVSAILADYGFATIKLHDDWQGADFIAQHIDGITYLKVQMKGRLTFDKGYIGKDLCICFRYDESWCLGKHDELLDLMSNNDATSGFLETASWRENGKYSWPSPNKAQITILEGYRIN